MRSVSFAMLMLSSSAWGQTNTNVARLTFTNGPVAPFWVQPAEQKKIEGVYFKTKINEFDQEVTHQLLNPTEDWAIVSGVWRVWTAKSDKYYWNITHQAADLGRGGKFDEDGELRFMIDGRLWTFTNTFAVASLRTTADYELQTMYTCRVSEDLIRTLATCKRASVRVPQLIGHYDHSFSAQELKRYGLFVRTYMPATNTSAQLEIK